MSRSKILKEFKCDDNLFIIKYLWILIYVKSFILKEKKPIVIIINSSLNCVSQSEDDWWVSKVLKIHSYASAVKR